MTGIAFDASGRMILAQRGDVQNPANFSTFAAAGPARVLRYAAESPDAPDTPGLWQLPPEEYGIGDANESRASSGGVALEYNVNADGTLDTATCSATLVASADSLGPERAVQGLQLNAAGIVRPANVPPGESAYVEWKPGQPDAKARGYAGGVAVLHSCAGDGGEGFPGLAGDDAGGFPGLAGGGGGGVDGATLPDVVDPTDPGLPDEDDDDLQVAKTAGVTTCNPKGGCVFNIEVTNPGAADIPGPIVIDEQIDAPQATLTGEPNAPWSCSKSAPFSCTHPGPVPAGGKLEPMRLVFAPNTPPETETLNNCAFVQGGAAPDGAGNCASIALDPNAPVQDGLIRTTKKGTGKCTANGPCTFSVSVSNPNNFEVPGPIRISDQIDAPQAKVTAAAPWKCSEAAPFVCENPNALPANTTIELELSVTPNTPPDKTTLKNCAVPLTGGGGKVPPADPNAPAKQIAPEKKSEAPFGGALFKFAKSTPQSFPIWRGLLHLTGGAGGNIGGVGAARQSPCRKFLRDGFSVRQSSGANVSFAPLTQINSKLFGTAVFISPRRPGARARFG
ncbi:MAG: hypothetical protein WDN31_14815 [Hyphomicrobium sp.]